MERDMRQDLFEQYERLSFSYYDGHNTGQMMSRLVSDLFDISEMAHHGPENLFISFIKIIGSFVFLFMMQWKLSLILLVIVVLMFLVSFLQNRRMQQTFLDNRRKIGNINASLEDSLDGIRVVQAFSNEHIEKQKFDLGNDAFLTSKKNNYHAMGSFQSINTFFIGMMYLVTIIMGGYFIAKEQMLPQDLAIFAIYIGIFISPIKILVELTEMLQKGFSGFRRFYEILQIQPDIKDRPNAKPVAHPHADIQFDHVFFHYEKESQVLNDIDFTIPHGKTIALVGPSGGGKTTICSLLPRFYDVTKGSIRIGDQDVRDIQLESLRQTIGIVQQDMYLFSGTIKENILYGKPNASDEEVIWAAKQANIHDFILSLPNGYDTYVGQRGTRLSGGQKQRISIARIFLKDPAILILDEATSALDNESEYYIQKSLDALSKDRTTLVIAHRLSTIRNADLILVIEQGSICEKGTHEQLIQNKKTYARYAQLVNA